MNAIAAPAGQPHTTRILVAVEQLPSFVLLGWREIFRMAGGQRIEGEAAVIEWTGTGEAPWPA